MFDYTVRRLLIAVPTLVIISLVIFLVLSLAPNDPMAQVPLTVPPEVKEKMREALGLGQPLYVQFWKWLVQFFWIEPQVLIDHYFGTNFSEDKLRVISWQTRAPVMDTVVQIFKYKNNFFRVKFMKSNLKKMMYYCSAEKVPGCQIIYIKH